MKIVAISDTHSMLSRVVVPDGDILVHAGDALSSGYLNEFMKFIEDFSKLPHKHKIYVPGNHDIITERNEDMVKDICSKTGIVYLNNTHVIIEGIKFFGSGITPRFHNWAWNRDSMNVGTSLSSENKMFKDIRPYWNAIPDDTDVLITHGPPNGIMDISVYSGDKCGCPYLLKRVMQIKPKFHIFGHIHNWHGTELIDGTTFVNASICTEKYEPTNSPIVLEICI